MQMARVLDGMGGMHLAMPLHSCELCQVAPTGSQAPAAAALTVYWCRAQGCIPVQRGKNGLLAANQRQGLYDELQGGISVSENDIESSSRC